ncbi:hypothetical protein BD309DRAFT_968496 [Dichomitus squalens]|nr:hypothetical protein BD309DRAFT_968496 [Dichomitus squalens]
MGEAPSSALFLNCLVAFALTSRPPMWSPHPLIPVSPSVCFPLWPLFLSILLATSLPIVA